MTEHLLARIHDLVAEAQFGDREHWADAFEEILELFNQTRPADSYEYYLETRHRVVARYFYDLGTRTGHWLPEEDPQWSEWRDGSGTNKKGSVYRIIGHVRSAIAHKSGGRNGHVDVEYQYRLFRRPVAPPPPPWEPCGLDGK